MEYKFNGDYEEFDHLIEEQTVALLERSSDSDFDLSIFAKYEHAGETEAHYLLIFENDGPIPHMHFYNADKSKGSIRLDKPEYFYHGANTCNLDEEELNALYEFSKDTEKWKALIECWNELNPENKVASNLPAPRYNKLHAVGEAEYDIVKEMANIPKDEYRKLPVNMWIEANHNKSKHGPIVKIQNNKSTNVQSDEFISISISKTPKVKAGKSKLKAKDLNFMLKVVADNYDLLIDHYNGKITDRQTLNALYKKYK